MLEVFKYNKIITTNKDILCFNIMKKAIVRCIDGKIRLLERWQWTNGHNSIGNSIIEESNIIKLT